MSKRFGALPEEWEHWGSKLGLGPHLLPCVMNPAAQPSAQSGVEPGSFAKIPSVYNSQGLAHGILGWPRKTATLAEIALWAEQPDYGTCLQGRDVVGLDIDVEDHEQVKAILALARQHLGFVPPMRTRASSTRVLLIMRITTAVDQPLRWRCFKTGHGLVELLATDRHYVVAGQHKSGDRYEWPAGLPEEIPSVALEVFEALWRGLVDQFAIQPTQHATNNERKRGPDLGLPDPVADFLWESGMVMGTGTNGALFVDCPWEHEHTSPNGGSSTVWFPAGTNGHEAGHFICKHSHCAERNRSHFINEIGFSDCNFEALPDEPSDKPVANRLERFRPIPWHEYCARPAVGWLVKGILPAFGLGMIYGAPGSGKSFLATDMAAAIWRGVTWRGQRVRQAKVLYVCAEGEGGFAARLKAYSQEIGSGPRDGFHIIAGRPNLVQDSGGDIDLVIRGARELGVGLVVIDTLAQVSAGGDENSSADMGRVIERCQRIRDETGAFVLLVHHSGKDDGRGARGWSGIKAAVEVEMKITHPDASSPVRFVEVTKQKDGAAGIKLPFQLTQVFLGLDADGDTITSCIVEAADAPIPEAKPASRRLGARQQVIIEALSGGLPMPEGDVISLAMKLCPKSAGAQPRKDNIKRTLADMIKHGSVIMKGDFLSLPDDGSDGSVASPHSLNFPDEGREEMRQGRVSNPHSLTHPLRGVSSEGEACEAVEEVE